MTITADPTTASGTTLGLGFTMPRVDLLAALTTIGLAIGRRPVVPVLGGVRITCSAGTVTLAGYDYDQAVTVTIPGAATSDGQALLHHRELLAVVTAAGKGEKKSVADALPVTVLQTLDTVTVTVDGFQVPLEADLALADYPDLPIEIPTAVTVNLDDFAQLAHRVATASGHDRTLPMLTATLLRIAAGEVTACATDRFRLTTGTVPATGPDAPSDGLVPTQTLTAALKRMTGPTLGIGLGRTTLTLTAGTTTTTVRLLDAEFPRFEQLIPAASATALTVTIDRLSLRRAVLKAAAMGAAKTEATGAGKNTDRRVHLTIGEHGVTVAPPAAGSRGPLVAAVVAGESVECCYDPTYLVDALDTFDAEYVTLHLTRPTRPVVLTTEPGGLEDPASFKHLLMPVRMS